MKRIFSFAILMALMLVIPFASASHDFDNIPGNKHPSEDRFDLKAISVSGPFGPDKIGRAFNVEAFREGEGHVIRSRPYFFRRATTHYTPYIGYVRNPHRTYNGFYHDRGCFDCVRYSKTPYSDDSYRVRTYDGFSNEFFFTDGKYPTAKFNRGFRSFTHESREFPFRQHFDY